MNYISLDFAHYFHYEGKLKQSNEGTSFYKQWFEVEYYPYDFDSTYCSLITILELGYKYNAFWTAFPPWMYGY